MMTVKQTADRDAHETRGKLHGKTKNLLHPQHGHESSDHLARNAIRPSNAAIASSSSERRSAVDAIATIVRTASIQNTSIGAGRAIAAVIAAR
jgi:hypothetical protein